MNYSGKKESELNGKSYLCPQGPFSWLNIIEIGKGPYLVSFLLLVLNILLLRQPVFTIEIPYAGSMSFALREVEGLNRLGLTAIILSVVSFASLLVPVMKFFEWKFRWFYPITATALVDCIAAAYIIVKKNELLENTLIGYAFEYLSIEINLTGSAWMIIVVNVLMLVCSIKMLIDVKKNEIIY